MVKTCPALFRVFPNSPVRLINYDYNTKQLGPYKVPMPYEFVENVHDIRSVSEFIIAEHAARFRTDKDIFGIVMVTRDFSVWVYAHRLIVVESGKHTPEVIEDVVNFKVERDLSRMFEAVGFERTLVYTPAHFIEYSRILFDRKNKRYFYKDVWHETDKELIATNSKTHYMALMDSPAQGILALANGQLEFLP
jgi:hypothetical protein